MEKAKPRDTINCPDKSLIKFSMWSITMTRFMSTFFACYRQLSLWLFIILVVVKEYCKRHVPLKPTNFSSHSHYILNPQFPSHLAEIKNPLKMMYDNNRCSALASRKLKPTVGN